MSPILLVARSEGKKKEEFNPLWKWIGKKRFWISWGDRIQMCSSIPHSTPLLYPLPHRTWLAVSLNDRKSRVRRPSCRRRRRRLIRLPANPVASDGATAGWMNMITHSHTGLTPQLHLSWLSLLICLRAAACLPCFWLPPSRSAHVCATVVLSPNTAGQRSELLCMRCSQLLTRALAKSERKHGWGWTVEAAPDQHGRTLISATWKAQRWRRRRQQLVIKCTTKQSEEIKNWKYLQTACRKCVFCCMEKTNWHILHL